MAVCGYVETEVPHLTQQQLLIFLLEMRPILFTFIGLCTSAMENEEVLINCGDKVIGLVSEWQEYRGKLENNQRREAAREEGSDRRNDVGIAAGYTLPLK